jgi:hypothetical protein
MTDVPRHPAKYSEPIIASLARLIGTYANHAGRPVKVLDPFAGTGRIHRLASPRIRTVGVEIEPEWASMHPDTICADSIAWMRARASRGGSGRFDVVATSPCYGNRFADHHNAQDGSSRRSYAHDLGRMPTDGAASVLPWGPRYWDFHAIAYRAIHSIVIPGGRFLLNVSDFVSKGELIHAVEWHFGAAAGAGFTMVGRPRWIETRRHGHGANRDARATAEAILVLERRP